MIPLNQLQAFDADLYSNSFKIENYNLSYNWLRSEMTLRYHMLVERYPELNGVVGGFISDCEIYTLLDGKKLAKLPRTFWPLIDSIFL